MTREEKNAGVRTYLVITRNPAVMELIEYMKKCAKSDITIGRTGNGIAAFLKIFEPACVSVSNELGDYPHTKLLFLEARVERSVPLTIEVTHERTVYARTVNSSGVATLEIRPLETNVRRASPAERVFVPTYP